jgi:hypothetical protein
MDNLYPDTQKLTPGCPLTMLFLTFDSFIPGGRQHRLCCLPLDGRGPANSFSSEMEVFLCLP